MPTTAQKGLLSLPPELVLEIASHLSEDYLCDKSPCPEPDPDFLMLRPHTAMALTSQYLYSVFRCPLTVQTPKPDPDHITHRNEEKRYVFFKTPRRDWTLYIRGPTLEIPLGPGSKRFRVRSPKVLVGTAPASWSLFQPEGKEPVKLNVIDQVGGMGPRKRTGQYWVLETGNGWGTVWVDNRVKGRGGKHRDFMDDGAGASADEGLLIVRRLQG